MARPIGVFWLLALGVAAFAPAVKPVPGFDRLATDPILHGERLAIVLGCTGCHGKDLTGNDWSEPGFGQMWSSNLTRSVPDYTDAQLERAISGGVRHDGSDLWAMPSHLFTRLRPDEMAAIIAFLRSRQPTGVAHPLPVFEAGARAEIAADTFRPARIDVEREGRVMPPDLGPAHDRARHIIRATCAECHGLDLRGGEAHPGASSRPDLRIAAGYDAAQFKALLQTGTPIGGRDIGLMGQVARSRYKHLTDAEREAIRAYLHRLAETAP